MRKNVIKENNTFDSVEVSVNGKNIPMHLESKMSVVPEIIPPEINVRKAKVTKDRTLDIEINEHYQDGGFVTAIKQCDYLVHDDLLGTFKKLIPHVIILCDTKEKKSDKKGFYLSPDQYDIEELSHFTIKGFSIGGSGDTEGVTLIAMKEVDSKCINMLSPFVKWEHDTYAFTMELHTVIQECKNAVMDYIGGKHAQKQLEMEFDGEPAGDELD